MNQQQRQRFEKTGRETFYLLDRKQKDPEHLEFHISGSTRNVYIVTIYLKHHNIFCTCPDAKSWAKKYNCICKHALFLLYRVLKVFNTTEHAFFRDLTFSEEDLANIQNSYGLLYAHLDDRVCNAELTARYKRIVETNSTKLDSTESTKPEMAKPFTVDERCGICFSELEETERDQCVACPVCKNNVHQECNDRWIASGQKTCVYCRQIVWISSSANKKSEYTNLNV